MNEKEMQLLGDSIDEITKIAKNMGLDFFPMRYEVCPADILYSIGAYGMPTRFSHWSFGKAFEQMKFSYDMGLSKIYELVINSNPCYAFLLEHNSLLQNKLIVAHVLGHSDFFKKNSYFSMTNRDTVDTMALHARQIKEIEREHGVKCVEEFIDHVLSIEEHIDIYQQFRTGKKNQNKKEEFVEEKDLLLFIQKNSRSLEDWQRQIIGMIRDEMLYFYPQMETKIMNEGWATFWHLRIMRELNLTEAETIEFAKMNANVIQPNPMGINPYYLGLKMFESLEKNYGRDFIFEVREMENDVSFLRNYLTADLIKEMDLYLFGKRGSEWKITNSEWQEVKHVLISQRTNGGFPYIVVKDSDYLQQGELYLLHKYEDLELDIKYVEKTLKHVQKLWGRTVHLETKIEDRSVLLSTTTDGKSHRKFL